MRLGLSLALGAQQAAGFSWEPIDAIAAARWYRADAGVTSAGSATRQSAGTISTGLLAGQGGLPVDGQGLRRLSSGRLLGIGGAPGGVGANSTNAVIKSDDLGRTWTVLLAAEAGPTYSRFKPGHTRGVVQDSQYIYVIGGDPIIGANGEVWRTPLSGNGTAWELVTSSAPCDDLYLFCTAVYDDELYILGGQTDMDDPGSGVSTVFRCTNRGLTWTPLADAPWTPRGAILDPVEHAGKLFVVAGGVYDLSGGLDVYRDDVWSFDNATDTWTEVLPAGHGQFAGRRYHSLVSYGANLWMFNGSVSGDADTAFAMSSPTGATWTAAAFPLPWGDTHASACIATPTGILLSEGFQSQNLYIIRDHTGPLISAWDDQGSANKDLSQSTDAKKPILQANVVGSRPAVICTGKQFLGLAAPDRDIAGGNYEVWVIAATFNYDTLAALGPNPPATIVGASNVSSWNNFGLNGGQLNYKTAAPTVSTLRGSGLADGRVRALGVRHSASSVQLYAGNVQQGATDTTAAFSTTWTGWDGIGAGFRGDPQQADEQDGAYVAIFEVCVLTQASDAAFRALWAARARAIYGAVT